MNSQYDNALLGILQNEGSLEKFLDVVFGFLMKRTDFFHIMTPENKKLGFPAGVNLQLILKAYDKYKKLFEEVQSHPKPISKAEENCKVNSNSNVLKIKSNNMDRVSECTVSENESQNSGTYLADSECYNGAKHNLYSWSQTIKDVDVAIEVPETVKARDLCVDISRKNVKIKIKQDGLDKVYFDKNLCWEVHVDDAVWTLNAESHQIQICLDKVQERWWESAFDDEEKIDTRKIDCSRPMHELDEEAQAKIEQLMYDEQQKRMGLPTSEQKKIQNILAEAWDKEGSPFRGTPCDPSSIKIHTN